MKNLILTFPSGLNFTQGILVGFFLNLEQLAKPEFVYVSLSNPLQSLLKGSTDTGWRTRGCNLISMIKSL